MSKIKRFFRRKSLLRNIILGILIVVTVGAAVGGVVALSRNTDKIDEALTYKSIGWTKYSIGGLASNGAYMSTDQSIYTEKAFECQGLNVTPIFDSEVSYQIYFYDQNNEFVHTTGRLTGTFVQDSVPFFAKYARIVITPNDDNKVTIFEKRGYAKQLEVKVYREQGFKNYTENLFSYAIEGKLLNGSNELVDSDVAGAGVSEYINVSSYNEMLIYRLDHPDIHSTKLFCYDSTKSFMGTVMVQDVATVMFTTSQGIDYYAIPCNALIPSNATSSATFIRVTGSSMPDIYCR